MPIRIEQLITEVQVATEDLPLSKTQIEQLTAVILDRLADSELQRHALERMMAVPRQARPRSRFRE